MRQSTSDSHVPGTSCQRFTRVAWRVDSQESREVKFTFLTQTRKRDTPSGAPPPRTVPARCIPTSAYRLTSLPESCLKKGVVSSVFVHRHSFVSCSCDACRLLMLLPSAPQTFHASIASLECTDDEAWPFEATDAVEDQDELALPDRLMRRILGSATIRGLSRLSTSGCRLAREAARDAASHWAASSLR